MSSPFHAGEKAVQRRFGVADDIEPWARQVIRSELPAEHREFYGALPFLVAAARDSRGRPWATLLAGAPGLAQAPHAGVLAVSARPARGDALERDLRPGADIGLLGIELATRRRNRVNGRIATADAFGFELSVEQSFGNCPQYIREREWRLVPETPAPERSQSRSLSDAQARWIEAADTFFIATGHRGLGDTAAFGMDASHRGGDPGFVSVEGERRVVFTDYAGNNHFNTLGNLVLDPLAGLLFVDFETGDLLQLTGRIAIDWHRPAASGPPERQLQFELDEAIELSAAVPLRWGEPSASVRSLRVVEKNEESDDVTSFVLAARDGDALATFEPGQHLPIELQIAGVSTRVRRTYSLSSAPADARYRITVKREREGLASRHLHDHVRPGDILSAGAPAGDFVLRAGARPVVLVSAGVGLTPLVSMLRHLAATESSRPVWFVHAARDGGHHPLNGEVRALAEARANTHLHVAYSRPRIEDEQGRGYDTRGRADGTLVCSLLPDLDADFYLCGPTSFMAALHADLRKLGVDPRRIYAESFGPSAATAREPR